jgi:hypothetical protein
MSACPNNTPAAVLNVAPIHPRSQTSVRDLLKLQNKLMTVVADGLRRAEFKPRRAGCMLHMKQHHPVTLWLTSYALDTRWWRVTFFFDDSGKRGELTFHRDEIDRNLVAELAEFLRNGPQWQWPLFAHWNNYPRYAWSRVAAESYAQCRLERESWMNLEKPEAVE